MLKKDNNILYNLDESYEADDELKQAATEIEGNINKGPKKYVALRVIAAGIFVACAFTLGMREYSSLHPDNVNSFTCSYIDSILDLNKCPTCNMILGSPGSEYGDRDDISAACDAHDAWVEYRFEQILDGEIGSGAIYWGGDAKPNIYIYSDTDEFKDFEVSLDYSGEFTTVYPEFTEDTGWRVLANSKGDLKIDNQDYYCLFWEGIFDEECEITTGDCVKGSEIIPYLEEKLEELGLSDHEAQEFIIFWAPKMQNNEYNLVSWDISQYEERAKLNVVPAPDTLIRVFMTYKPLDSFVYIAPDELDETPIRQGVTVVEWGGTILE